MSLFISKQIDKLGIKKATGYDGISAKLLKLAKPSIVAPVTDLVNTTLLTSEFPDPLKNGQVAPIHKKTVLWKREIIARSAYCLLCQRSMRDP